MPTSPWTTRGFDAFRRGTFENGGQNLYVSRAGVLQRIHLFDLNRDGHFDLLLCNSQAHWERPPAYVYEGPSRRDLPAEGAVAGAIADLNGDGRADLILGMLNNGISRELNAMVYYGDARGWSENRQTRLPAPCCTAVAAGDFNDDGRVDLAFSCAGKLRLFYQNDLGGFDALRPVDTDIPAGSLDAADLTGDGFADLYVLRDGEKPRVYHGGPDGLRAERFTELPFAAQGVAIEQTVSAEEAAIGVEPLARIIGDRLFVPAGDVAKLATLDGNCIDYPCTAPLAVAAGRVTGGKQDDIVVAGYDKAWLFVEGDPRRRIALPGDHICDVAVGDLDGDGFDDIALCVNTDGETWSVDSLVYRGRAGGVHDEPLRYVGEGPRRALITEGKLVLVNQQARNAVGRVPPTIYLGSPGGFDVDNRIELTGLGAVNGVGCDLTDNGAPDLLIANCAENALHLDPGSFVFYGRDNTFNPDPDLVLPTHAAMAVVVGDVNQDGRLDAVFSNFVDPEIKIFFGCAGGGFDLEHPQTIETGGITEARRMCLVDLNNDGWLDLVLTFMQHDRAYVLWGSPNGFDWNNKQPLGIVRPATPIACDLTGNGYRDLIVGGHKRSDAGPHDSFVYIYWNGPDGLREDNRTLLPANAVLGMAVADFNNDGALDLYVGNYSDGRYRDLDSHIYWGATDRNEPYFSETRVTHVRTHSAAGCIAADFNEDGRVDLAIANHKTHGDHKGVSWVVWNGPDGLDFANPTKLPSFGPHGLMHTPPGNQADRGDVERYVSQPYEMPQGAAVDRVEWEGELGPKTWVDVHVRTAATREGLNDAPWRENNEGASGGWLQYRLLLGAVNSGSTPRITAVTVRFKNKTSEI